MDPFIEGCGIWDDFRFHLVEEISRQLADSVPHRYLIRIDVREYFEPDEDEHRERFVKILDAANNHRLVTHIEVLSENNKLLGSTGRTVYCRKRKDLMLGEVNFVEIVLLRGGERMPMVDPWPTSPYTIFVSRVAGLGTNVWPVFFLNPLPLIPVPLLKPDADISINLQPMIESIYRRSRYSYTIDYRKPIDPPLAADEAAWLKKQLRTQKTESVT
jgi:hypothetical protein